ncbi:MAG TPA: maleylpyruvate isomerase N-terminal domain-containing protein, partial [Acidimicrobiales bacterium]|nr:maleylpyruvate isomerase N-terminal domain-containing protein [Acidimicrobiales bacterium]
MALPSEEGDHYVAPRKPTMPEIVADLAIEHRELDDVVENLPASSWAYPTPSAGWTVADQIGHL